LPGSTQNPANYSTKNGGTVMRVIGYIDHPAYKISVFSWAEKYIIKIEAGFFEQSYKFPQSALFELGRNKNPDG
jgi:hypothetical protein